jgi:hypothetical protein
MGFFEKKIDSKNHMGAQMKGGEIKGSEVRVVFTAMDAFSGENRSQVASICWSQVPKICWSQNHHNVQNHWLQCL